MITRRRFLGAGAAALAACAASGRRSEKRPGGAGMVASNQKPATRAGLDILRAGGNAADAAVAVAAALAVTEPCSTGLGGDCFALYYRAATREVTALNGSGRAPAALSLELIAGRGLREVPVYHALNVTVPGACAGWHDLLARHGRLPMATVLARAIALAEDGFAVGPVTAHFWHEGRKQLSGPGAAALVVDDGRGPTAGQRLRNPDLARVLRAIAGGGKDAYYRGEIAAAIVRAVGEAGGVLALDDLAAHQSTWDEPISTTYRGVRVWECPPNGQGLVALLALNLLEGFDLRGQDPLGAERLHLLAEALRLAFADGRRAIADPRAVPVPTAALLDKGYAAKRRALIDARRAAAEVRPGAAAGGSDTVYFCVVDGDGDACSFIGSNYSGFGTGIVPAGLGFSLQNRGANFSLEPRHPNAVAPRKRPYHTIIPALLTREDGTLDGPFGVMGGFMQPQGHVQVVLALIDDGATPQAALDRPRIMVDPAAAAKLAAEEGISEATLAELSRRGHAVSGGVSGFHRSLFGRGQVIRRDPSGRLTGGSDPRGDGEVSSTS